MQACQQRLQLSRMALDLLDHTDVGNAETRAIGFEPVGARRG